MRAKKAARRWRTDRRSRPRTRRYSAKPRRGGASSGAPLAAKPRRRGCAPARHQRAPPGPPNVPSERATRRGPKRRPCRGWRGGRRLAIKRPAPRPLFVPRCWSCTRARRLKGASTPAARGAFGAGRGTWFRKSRRRLKCRRARPSAGSASSAKAAPRRACATAARGQSAPQVERATGPRPSPPLRWACRRRPRAGRAARLRCIASQPPLLKPPTRAGARGRARPCRAARPGPRASSGARLQVRVGRTARRAPLPSGKRTRLRCARRPAAARRRAP
mmetsp:Transcript_26085/g.89660  ORF Transcript_26085/g.89660 Transcript_26085/m.89660 type:complete len:276 (-) Transcript_26085:990-1817(-)